MSEKKKDEEEPVLQDWRWDNRDGSFWYFSPEERAQRNSLDRRHDENRWENSRAVNTGDITEGGRYRDLVKLMGGD